MNLATNNKRFGSQTIHDMKCVLFYELFILSRGPLDSVLHIYSILSFSKLNIFRIKYTAH
jgi:hypothetical protein